MKSPIPVTLFLCQAFWAFALPAQIPGSEPYGGPHVVPGSFGPVKPGAIRNGAGSTVCPTTDPCVLTGQYNSFRNSQNQNEVKLATMTDFSSFTAVGFFQFDPTDLAPGKTYNSVEAQPLYMTGVSIGGTTHNVLIVATLNDSVYAFDADTGATLWKRVGSTALYTDCSPTVGQAFTDLRAGGNPGVPNLGFYGIVSTPVVDIAPTPPVMYTVLACSTPQMGHTYEWYLNALDVTTGNDLIVGGLPITQSGFRPTNELNRPALLLTHPTGSSTYLYVAFGTGVNESTGGDYAYSGDVFGYSIQYPLQVTPMSNTFDTSASLQTDNIFPINAPPLCAKQNCDQGDNWIGNGGGIWQTGKGPSSDATGNVFVSVANGPFDCTLPQAVINTCTDPKTVLNWGESVVKMPPPTGTALPAPTDFFTPFQLSYPAVDPEPAPYQFEELNRFDMDMGMSGAVLFTATLGATQFEFAMTSNKVGQIYVMPVNGFGLGAFRPSDSGLTTGNVRTQTEFQASRLPNAQMSTPTCPVAIDFEHFRYRSCDQISELAFWNNYLFVWPINETVRAYQGAITQGMDNIKYYQYAFNTTPAFDPCAGQVSCNNFPPSGYPGGEMAIAANGKTNATLWGIVPVTGSETTPRIGSLYAYTIATSPTLSLTPAWNSTQAAPPACPAPVAPLPLQTWQIQPMSEPTLANGRVYVGLQNANAVDGTLISGVLVYGNCH